MLRIQDLHSGNGSSDPQGLPEEIFASGKLFELVHVEQKDGRVFEIARRAPGVRIIIADKAKRQVLLTKEYRQELRAWDYRLPGGKVFDSLAEYEAFRSSLGDIVAVASKKAIAEAAEEAGVDIKSLKFLKKSTLGATVEWDLYVFEAREWTMHSQGQSLEAGEQVESVQPYSFEEVERMILGGNMQEERIALILLQWLKKPV